MSASSFDSSGIAITPLSARGLDLVRQVNTIIDDVFGDPIDPGLLELSPADYFDVVQEAQTRVNALQVVRRIFEDDGAVPREALGGQPPAAQQIAYLRAVRPHTGERDEYVDFHRESFFNADMRRAWNVWIAVRGVVPENSILYVPESQSIPEDRIETVNDGEEAGVVKRFSGGHKVGMLYDPLRIVGGVDFSRQETLYVPPGHMAVFDANLIHGGGANRTGQIRFSMDFRIIASGDISQTGYNVAADGAYFADVE